MGYPTYSKLKFFLSLQPCLKRFFLTSGRLLFAKSSIAHNPKFVFRQNCIDTLALTKSSKMFYIYFETNLMIVT